jgi:hypothetical protein
MGGTGLGSGFRLPFIFLMAAIIPACGGSSNNKPPPTPALAPTGLVATQGTTARIDLTWTDTADNEAGFKVERSQDGGLNYVQIASLDMNTQVYSDLGLLPNRTYFYRVCAWNALGNTTFAGPANATTKALAWKSTIGGPGIRGDHSAIYDSLGRRMIVFGGMDDLFTFYNDTWSLNLLPTTAAMTTPPVNHWSPLTTTGTAPTERMGHSAIYDIANNRMIVFGGQDNFGYQNDIHVLTLGATPTWSTPTISGTPPAGRLGHTAVYDAANQQMVVFGGNDAAGEKNDVLLLSLPAAPPFVWSPSPAGGGPVKRTEHSAIYDGTRGQVILFGGLDNTLLPDGSVLNNDTWSLKLSFPSFWTQLSFSGTPFFRFHHSAIYDAANQRMIVFGGDTTAAPTPSSELWTLRLDVASTWTFLSPSSGAPPAARYGQTTIYDSGSQRMIMYGGYDNSGFPAFDDTWITDF